MISRAIDKLARLSLIDRNKLAVLFEQDHLRKLLEVRAPGDCDRLFRLIATRRSD
jgi:hypothetical protein